MPDVDLILKYRLRGVVMDTNILLLYVVGRVKPERIDTFKPTRTASYGKADFAILARVLDKYVRLMTTPHVLTEVSNLLGKLSRREWGLYRHAFAAAISIFDERSEPSRRLAGDPMFIRLGLTDTAIVESARQGYLVLTDDAMLANVMYEKGLDVVNFNHLRGLA